GVGPGAGGAGKWYGVRGMRYEVRGTEEGRPSQPPYLISHISYIVPRTPYQQREPPTPARAPRPPPPRPESAPTPMDPPPAWRVFRISVQGPRAGPDPGRRAEPRQPMLMIEIRATTILAVRKNGRVAL